ncbi:MAG TPA: hypothetical protein VGS58_22640, partial [Candidatus Sulfopaludibacter sp.]|nr:hypothetical protein [Candidatus Sulfopaludibacter sp.]
MSLAPTSRLLWMAALVMLPALAVAGFDPAATPQCCLVLAACLALAVYDALGGRRRVRLIRLTVPEQLRLTKGVAAVLPVTVENRSGDAARIRLAAVAPPAIVFDEAVKQTTIVDAGRSRIDWTCSSDTRGDHRIDALLIETASPFGFWNVRARHSTACTLRVYPNLRDRATAGLFLRTAK